MIVIAGSFFSYLCSYPWSIMFAALFVGNEQTHNVNHDILDYIWDPHEPTPFLIRSQGTVCMSHFMSLGPASIDRVP